VSVGEDQRMMGSAYQGPTCHMKVWSCKGDARGGCFRANKVVTESSEQKQPEGTDGSMLMLGIGGESGDTIL
jgi:hypothetical protein